MPFWAIRIGCKLCLQQHKKVMRSQLRILLWLSGQEKEVLHLEILHETEAEKGRENRKVRGEVLPCAEHLQGESQRQSKKRSRQQQAARDKYLQRERELSSTSISYLHFYSLHFDPPAACDCIQSHL